MFFGNCAKTNTIIYTYENDYKQVNIIVPTELSYKFEMEFGDSYEITGSTMCDNTERDDSQTIKFEEDLEIDVVYLFHT